MARIEREDIKDSFQTVLRISDASGKQNQELLVFVWEADVIEAKVKAMTWTQINAFYTLTDKRTIKGS